MGTVVFNRKQLDEKISALPRTVATCFGLKRKQGELTPSLCFKVFVTEKSAGMAADETVPSQFHSRKRRWRTDVEELHGFRLESKNPVIRSTNQQGILSCYAGNREGFYGVSCEHVIAGKEGIIMSAEKIKAWMNNEWREIGWPFQGVTMAGTGKLPDFGILDAGLIAIDPEIPEAERAACEPLLVFSDIKDEKTVLALLDMEVTSISFSGEELRGVVSGVLCHHFDPGRIFYCDLLIESRENRGLTLTGDSGTVWRDSSGRAIAVHVGGFNPDEQGRSRIAAGFFIHRLAKVFRASLFECFEAGDRLAGQILRQADISKEKNST